MLARTLHSLQQRPETKREFMQVRVRCWAGRRAGAQAVSALMDSA